MDGGARVLWPSPAASHRKDASAGASACCLKGSSAERWGEMSHETVRQTLSQTAQAVADRAVMPRSDR